MKFNISCQSRLLPQIIVKDHLERLDVNYRQDDEGFFEIDENIPRERLSWLGISLSKYGIEILDDDKGSLVQRIKDILFESVYGERSQLQTLSVYLTEKLGFSYGHISGVFVSQTFTSIEKYAIMLKTERAKRMIIEDEWSLKEISNKLGYSSIGHFSKQFKKTTGITISMFKKIINNRKHGR